MGLLVLCLFSRSVSAQTAEPVATLSLDSVAIAQVFELRVRVHVPPGIVVYFPDTIPATEEIESFGSVSWQSRRAPDGGAELTLVYPLIPFGAGTTSVPGVDIVTTPLSAGAPGESIADGSRVGAWSDVPRGLAPGITRVRTPDLTVRVRPLQTAEDIVAGVSPRGPDDVMGIGWSPWTILFLSVFTALFVVACAPWVRSLLAAIPHRLHVPDTRPMTAEEARIAALAELERIAATPYLVEAERSLYGATSGAVRGYVQRLDPEWGPGLTSTELMDGLGASEANGAGLAEEMFVAERVKFGRHRTGGSAFAAHLGALRDWLSTKGSGHL
ncbi:MAG: hypothetical protein FJ207_06955 [Gemmatimonadetes bacterium]|nr:hypothetical protein [Gemmatimonadota bacterium]